jgi:hypothetical protein
VIKITIGAIAATLADVLNDIEASTEVRDSLLVDTNAPLGESDAA